MSAERPDAIDTRLVFRVYACVAGIGGLSAFVLGTQLLSRSTVASASVATIGLAGALNLVLATYAAAFSTVEDPGARANGLKAFAAGHVITGAFLWALAQWSVGTLPGADTRASFALGATLPFHLLPPSLFVTASVLFYLAYTASPGSRFTMTLKSTAQPAGDHQAAIVLHEKEGAASMRRLRSQYEEQIRQAARQEERARLARDLHDAVKQQLFVVQTAAATIQMRFDTDPAGARGAIDDVRTAAREAMTEMDAMLDQLQATPLENTGLVDALKKQCEALGFRTGATVTVDVQSLPPKQLLPPGAQLAMFRVAQEALANIGRHARARQVFVRLGMRRREFVLEVADDGIGFDPTAGRAGMGIGNMQARAHEVAGHFELASSSGAGTTVMFAVPLTASSANSYLLLSMAFASALVACVAIVTQADAGVRTWWIAAGWISLIGTARYLVALYRVRQTPLAER